MKGCKLTEEELDAMAEAEEYLGNFADCANCKALYLEWLGYNEYEIEEVETEIKNGEKPLEFESYKYYTWESGYNKAQEEATHNYDAIIADYDKRIAELEMQLEEWKKCFLSCSSPFCSKHFPTVESSGVLGNMEKKENLKRGTK